MDMEYFDIFGLPPVLHLDLNSLERKFHELSRQYHPDYHTGRSPEEREESLRMTALVNDAYRTLRDPTKRAEYLVRSQGLQVDRSRVPQSLLAEVFEINEELERLRSVRDADSSSDSIITDLRAFQEEISRKQTAYAGQLEEAFTEWDRLVSGEGSEDQRREHLGKIADLVAQSAYLKNLKLDIEHEVSR